MKNKHVITQATKIELGICGHYNDKIYFVNYDWTAFPNNQILNTKHFFKLYTMVNDSQDILWHTTFQLN